MSNIDLFKKLNNAVRNNVLDQLNKKQIEYRNQPMTMEYFLGLDKTTQHMILRDSTYFETVLSYYYTKMLERAEKYKDAVKQKYARDYIESIFGRGSVSNIRYDINESIKASVRKAIDNIWQKEIS